MQPIVEIQQNITLKMPKELKNEEWKDIGRKKRTKFNVGDDSYVNQRFGRLVIISLIYRKELWGREFNCVDAKCDCNNQITVCRISDILRGEKISCGCLKIENRLKAITKYPKGVYKSSLYRTWDAMIQRCENPNTEWYCNYGGRGIKVCRNWRDFGNFRDDIISNIGDRPNKLTLDRKENNLHYSCGHCEECIKNHWKFNCKWSTRKEQNRNMRRNKWFIGFGETKCLEDWANDPRNVISFEGVKSRLRNGWGVEKALMTPSLTK